MNLLRNIIAISFGLPAVVLVSIILYVLSFFVSKQYLRRCIRFLLGIVRTTMCFIIGIRIRVVGVENIPNEPCIFASKHQSFLETTFLYNIYKNNTIYCYKKEIASVPLWGRIAKSFGGIPIDRSLGTKMIYKVIEESSKALKNGDSIVIFPEGTRTAPGKSVPFKRSIAKLYEENQEYKVIPVALNTGLSYPKGSFLGQPKEITIKFMPAIPAGLSSEEFMAVLEQKINNESTKLIK